MKKFYAYLVAFGLMGAIQAQQLQTFPGIQPQPNEAKADRIDPIPFSGQREVLWSENFANGLNSTNGLWLTDGSHAEIWDHVMAVDSACWSTFGDPAVNFTTKANGFMIFHSDSANCVNSNVDPPIFNQTQYQGELISPSIDLSGQSAVLVSFEHRFRHCCNTAFEIWFSVSTDGGVTWTDFDVTADTPVNIYNTNLNPSLNISQVAAFESDVRFKYTWNATNSSSHYFWAIDDITVEVPVDNDMALVDLNYQQWDFATAINYADLKHTIYHESQVRPLNIQGFATNKGAVEQTGVVMHATIETPTGIVNLISSAQNVQVADTAIFEIPWTPDNIVGDYTINIEITQDAEDEIPENNFGSDSIMVDDFVMARDNRARSGAFTNYLDELITALAYTLTESATVYAIDVALDHSSDLGTFFGAQLMDDDFGFIVDSEVASVDESMMNENGEEKFVRLNLETPYEAAAGESIFPGFVHYGGDEQANIALSGFCPDQTCFVWATIQTDGQTCAPCFYNSTPMIRPVFAFASSIEGAEVQEGIRLGQNVPNPARDYTIIAVETAQMMKDARIEIRDLKGRLIQQEVLGTLPPGEYTQIINTSGIPAGVYLYTLNTENHRQTKRMTVVR